MPPRGVVDLPFTARQGGEPALSTGPGADSAPAPTALDKTDHPRKSSMFSSLKIRNYRLFATGAVVSNTGTWMARITQDWLVLSITGSSAAVGITTALQFLPMLLFGLYGGVIADRFAKRNLLLVTQAAHRPVRALPRRAHPQRERPGLARLPRRLLPRPRHRRRQPDPAVLRLRDGRPRPGPQRGQPELGELPVGPADRPRRRGCPDHRASAAAGRSCSTDCPSSPRSPACC